MSADRSAIDLDGLPGADLVIDGVADLRGGKDTAYAALVRTAAARLREIGISVPEGASPQPSSHRLYELLSQDDPAGAYGRYNALLGRMASFANAAEQRAAQR
jgi:hypothetical protein